MNSVIYIKVYLQALSIFTLTSYQRKEENKISK